MLSLPLYLLCGLARRRRLISQEAAVKYFLLGAFTSAIFLYGLALLYGYAGLRQVRRRSPSQARAGDSSDVLLIGGLALLVVGLLFKASVGPFHLWTPGRLPGRADAGHGVHGGLHQGRRVRRDAAGAARWRSSRMSWTWRPVLWGVAGASMVIGAVIGITQTDMKRMLAYSSVAHAGFMLLGVLAMTAAGRCRRRCSTCSPTAWPRSGVRRPHPGPQGRRRGLARLGLGRAGQALAGAGRVDEPVPASVRRHPADRRVHRQVRVFTAAMAAGMAPLVVLAMVATAVTAFFYLRIVVLMYFAEPADRTARRSSGARRPFTDRRRSPRAASWSPCCSSSCRTVRCWTWAGASAPFRAVVIRCRQWSTLGARSRPASELCRPRLLAPRPCCRHRPDPMSEGAAAREDGRHERVRLRDRGRDRT